MFKFIPFRSLLLVMVSLLFIGFAVSTALADDDPSETTSLLIKMKAGLTEAEKAAVIAANGGTEVSAIRALRLHVVEVPTSELDAIMQNYQNDTRVQRVEISKTRQVRGSPSDPSFANQWALPKIGWDMVFGNVTPTGTAKVAVLDTGVEANHEDLAGKMVGGTSILDGSNGATDPHGHGTWLAGIVAASTNNNKGIAGVAYAGVKIMPVTVLGTDGTGQDSDIIEGIVWAVENGANVILMGFSNPDNSESLQEAIDYAWENGVVLVAATGNDATGEPTYPAGHRGVMGVSATNQNDALAGFSNYGATVFIAAPGVSIDTTDNNNSYYSVNGTSASSAIVAGVAAFMKAVDPSLSNGVIVGRLARTADPAGTQEQTGNGRVNMAAALADTSIDEIQPVGVAGGGGPYVGPYRIAAPKVGSVTVGAQSPNPVTAGNSATYTITVNRGSVGGSSGTFTANLSITTTLPTGATASFSPNPVSFTPSDNTKTATLTISTTTSTPGGTTSFTVKAETSATDFATGNGQLVVQAACTAPSISIHPASQTKTVGESVTFSVTATGTAPLSYQWKKGDVNVGTNSISYTISSVLTSDAGSYTVVVSNACGSATSNVATLTVNKATPTVTTWPTASAITYGQTLAASTLSGGVASVSGSFAFTTPSTAPNAGTAFHSVTFTPTDTANYNTVVGSVSVTVNKATPSVTTWPTASAITYGQTLAASTLSGGVASVSGSFAFTTPSTAPNAGTAFHSVTFTPTDTANYNTVEGSVSVTVNKAVAIITLDNLIHTYDGTPKAATATTAPEGLTTVTITYDGSTTPPTNAGSYAVVATLNNPNYTGTASGTLIITKADATVTVVSDNNPSTYGDLVTFTATVTRGETDDPVTEGTIIFVLGNCDDPILTFPNPDPDADPSDPISLDDNGQATFSISSLHATEGGDPHIITACYSGSDNYNASDGSVEQSVDKAATTTTVTCPASVTYNGSAQEPCTAVVTGPGGFSQNLTVNYSNNTNAGTATASATFAGNANLLGSSDTKNFTIEKAAATCTVNGWTGTYDGNPHGATGFCTGIGGATLSGLDLGAKFKDVPGGTANWTFTDVTGNYNNQSGSVAIVINKAASTTTVSCPASVTYNGSAHTPCSALVTGPGGLNETLTVTYSNNINAGTATASATFAGNANLLGSSDTKTFTINKADQTIIFNTLSDKILGEMFTVSATGGGSGNPVTFSSLTPLTCSVSDTTVTTLAVGTCTIRASQAGNDNYNPASNVDRSFRILYASAASCPGTRTILQPINADGTSVFKQGSTVPAKFRVADSNCNSIGTPGVVTSFRLIQTISGTTSTDVNEDVISTTPDTAFRWSASDQQWIFNINTRNLQKSRTYVYRIDLNDGTFIEFRFGLK